VSAYFVIFGAAVRADGQPSGTLRRRVEGALAAAQSTPDARFMPTGGRGATGYVEAEVMADILRIAGIPDEAIVCEDQARDTLDSVRRCDALLRSAGDATSVTPCTSRYHLPRCAALFWALGWRVRIAETPGDFGHLPFWKLALFWLKEVVALPYDLVLIALDNGRRAAA
jgi:uncharacterized SAM-binding protein YcdF (DUF218 family)